VLGTWDRLHAALPFGRGVFLWGEPIEIAADLEADDVERARAMVERRMNELALAADNRVGHGLGAPVATATVAPELAGGERR
jgi:hypothetical protein